jgi:RNA polymerase sigma-70 factor (ECF subfamily)
MDSWSGEKPPSLEQDYIKDEMNKCIKGHIEDLPPDFKAVVYLSEMEGLKNKEIAEILGISLDTVKIRIHRGRKILKKELEEDCNFSKSENNEPACEKK